MSHVPDPVPVTAGPGAAPVPPVSPARRAAVDRARLQWIDRLIDLSRRNNLLYFRDLQKGSLDLSAAPSGAVRDLMQSGRGDDGGIALSSLVGPDALARAAEAVREIHRRAIANFEERGLDTMFLALGLATWPAGDGGRPVSAPVLLLPVTTFARGRSGAWSLARTGEVRANDVLLHALAGQHGVAIDGDALLAAWLDGVDDEEGDVDLEPLFEHLATLAADVEGFAIQQRRVLGNFSFQKMAIVRDLRELDEALARHDLVAGIAGDAEARAAARAGRTAVDPRGLDRQPPDAEFLVLDADSSQHAAIAATLQGQNGVVSGPPGTGKSQTIANLIAELTARGRTVLFVAEKRAALDVVLQRLSRAGLGHLCLDLHGADVSRRRVAEQLGHSLELVRDTAPPDTAALHARFSERRARLNAHAAGLHAPRPPSGLSLYQLYGLLVRLPEGVASGTRFRGEALARLTPEVMERALEALREAASLAGLVTGDDPSPWAAARLVPGAVAGLLDRVRELSSHTWPACVRALGQLALESGVAVPATLGDARRLLSTVEGLDALLARYDARLLDEDLERLERDLAPAAAWPSRAWATLFDGAFRGAVRAVRAHAHQGPSAAVSGAQALADVRAARSLAAEWRALAPPAARPVRCPSLAAAHRLLPDAFGQLAAVATVVARPDLDARPLAWIAEWLGALAADATTPVRLLRVQELAASLEGAGVGAVLSEIRARKPAPSTWPDLLRHAWWTSCLEAVQQAEPSLAAFDGRLHDELVEEFEALDRERLEAAVARVRRAHAERVVAVRNACPVQSELVAREAQKRSRHLPLRRLFAEAPDVLLALRPCWMASPLSVSQLLPGDRPYFDAVVFDEASQVLPEDAVTSLLRGKRAVIAGDARQLPPTTFFAAGLGEDEDADEEAGAAGTAGFESVLDVMAAFLDPPWSLDWHYRSRDEALIAFSNHHIYGDRLVTFPGPGGLDAVRWVDAQRWDPPAEADAAPEVADPGAGTPGGASREVQCVVHLVLEHARTRPQESLGVIALGIQHAERIELALDRARQRHPELDGFFAQDRAERFFVKNLERVQGDERDAIVLTVGYGKDASGRVLYRFGPLLMEGGERRLNVAVTRARRRMTVVSSFSHADLQADYPKLGVRLLRAYLEYAAAGGRRPETSTPTGVPLNAFEQSVADTLTRRGLRVVPQLGASRYRIDLALTHPERPGRYVLAVECDGASYHASPTARDRDRLRQQHLEALGWRFHRIWSTDWFLRREEEVARLLEAFRDAVAHADAPDAQRPAPVPVQAAGGDAGADPPPPEPAFPARGPRPPVVAGRPVDEYGDGELAALARWIAADGRLRTDEEWLAELIAELGFRRRGTRIVGALRRAIAAARR